MNINLKPLGNRVLVERIEEAEMTASGIFIPDTAKEKQNKGRILAVGPGKRDKAGNLFPMDVKVGDIVLFGKWGGNEVKIKGKEYLLMKDDDIYGIILE